MDFSRYVEWIKLPPRYLLPIWFFTAFAVFGSEEALAQVGMVGLVSEYRPWFGFVFLLSTSLLLAAAFVDAYNRIAESRRKRAQLKQMEQRLHHLAEPEKRILRRFIYGQTRSQDLDMSDGTVGGLTAEGMIFRSSNFGNIDRWAHNIQPWAWDYLTAHPELLALDDVDYARGLLLETANAYRDTPLIYKDVLEEVYRMACANLERDAAFVGPHEWRLIEEAKELLLKRAVVRDPR